MKKTFGTAKNIAKDAKLKRVAPPKNTDLELFKLRSAAKKVAKNK